jgi:hypothetical protein
VGLYRHIDTTYKNQFQFATELKNTTKFHQNTYNEQKFSASGREALPPPGALPCTLL